MYTLTPLSCEGKSESQRYLPIATTMNTIMLEYDQHRFGLLPCLCDDNRIIVIPNDLIESNTTRDGSADHEAQA